MNTALNLVSLPKDTANSVASGDLSAENRTGSLTDPAAKRQDLADGREKNASFAKVLKDETRQEPTRAETRDNHQKPGSDDSAAENASTGTAQETRTHEESGKATNRVSGGTPESGSESDNDSQLAESLQTDSKIRVPKLAGEGIISDGELELTGEAKSVPTDGDAEVVTAPVADSLPESGASGETAGSPAAGTAQTNMADVTVAEPAEQLAKASPANMEAIKDIADSSGASGTHSSGYASTADAKGSVALTQSPGRSTGDLSVADAIASATGKESSSENTSPSLSVARTDKPVEVTSEKASTPTPSEASAKSVNVSVSASLESFPAAGKELPTSGKALPAGLFFQTEGAAPVISRGEQSAQATQPIDLNNALTARQGPVNLAGGEKDFDPGAGKLLRSTLNEASAQQLATQSTSSEIAAKADFTANPSATAGAADRMLRSILNSQSLTLSADAPTLAASTTPATDGAALSPALPNALLQVSADKSFAAAKSPLLSGADSALNLNIAAQAGSAEWQNQLSSRIRWMGDIKLSSAELKLHPAELGAVEIQISTEDDQTRVSFITSNAAAKEVIESSLPRLRELLAEGGLQLEQGDVAHRDLPDDKQAQELANGSSFTNEEGEDSEANQATLHFTRKSTSQIDHYV